MCPRSMTRVQTSVTRTKGMVHRFRQNTPAKTTIHNTNIANIMERTLAAAATLRRERESPACRRTLDP